MSFLLQQLEPQWQDHEIEEEGESSQSVAATSSEQEASSPSPISSNSTTSNLESTEEEPTVQSCKPDCIYRVPSSLTRTQRTAQNVYHRNNPNHPVKDKTHIYKRCYRRFCHSPSPLRIVYSAPDARFPQVQLLTEYITPFPHATNFFNQPSFTRVSPGVAPSEMLRLRDLMHTANRFAAAALEQGFDWLLFDLKRSMGMNVDAPETKGKGKMPQTMIVLDIVTREMMPGQEDICFGKRISSQGHVWWVRLRVGAEQGKKRVLSREDGDLVEGSEGKGKRKRRNV